MTNSKRWFHERLDFNHFERKRIQKKQIPGNTKSLKKNPLSVVPGSTFEIPFQRKAIENKTPINKYTPKISKNIEINDSIF